jgi:PAS domain S-box-containing protein
MIGWHIDLSTQAVTFSDAPEAVFGFPPGSFGHTLADMMNVLHPEDRERAEAVVHQAIAHHQSYALEFRLLHPDGHSVWVKDAGQVIRDAAGQPTFLTGISQNITQFRKDQEALYQIQEFKQQVLESSRDCIKVLDLAGRLQYMNPGGVQLMEMDDCNQFLNQEWLSFWREDERSLAQAALETAKAGGVGYFEAYCPTVKGTPKWWDVVSTPIKDGQGKVIQILSISRDITDRKQAERQLRQQEQRYHYIFEAVGVSIWEEDFAQVKGAIDQLKAQGVKDFRQYFIDHPEVVQELITLIKPVDVNEASLRLFEARDKQELLASFPRIVLPETLPALVDELVALAEHRHQVVSETVLQTLTGQRLNVLFSMTFPPAETNFNRVLISIVDISDRQRSQQHLQESEERLQIGVQVAGLGLAKVDYATSTVELSPEAAQLYGIPSTELTISRDRLHDTFHPEEREELLQIIAQVIDPAGAGWFAREHRVVWPTGEVRWLSVRKQVFFNRSSAASYPTHAILAALDVTEQKQAEAERDRLLQEAQVARETAETANRLKDEFLTVLSHELRTPMSPILGWAKMLQARTFASDKVQEALATIERNAKLQVQLIDDLLDIARILRGKLALNLAPVSLLDSIYGAMETVRLAAEAKAIDLQFTIAPPAASDQPLLIVQLNGNFQIMGDAGRLQQIIWNLLSNAVKFTPQQGQIWIQLQLVDQGQTAQVTVRDTGKGIAPEFIPYIFDAFRQQDASTTRRFGGLGLGLTIVRQLVEAHGGTIAVSSPGDGQGTTFTMRLPLLPGTDLPASVGAGNQEPDLAGIRILVVDDEPDALYLLQVILESEGAIATLADSAATALEALQTNSFDVLISDIGMPDADGYDLIQTLRSLPIANAQVHAIALTAYAGRSHEQKAIAAGFQQHIAKPIDPTQVLGAMKVWLEAYRSTSAPLA